jgi:hypothetical protein
MVGRITNVRNRIDCYCGDLLIDTREIWFVDL